MKRQASLPGFPFGDSYVNETNTNSASLGGSYLNSTAAPSATTLNAVAGSIALAPRAAAFARSVSFTATPAALAISGKTASFVRSTTLSANPASLSIAPQTASFTRSTTLNASASRTSLSPQAATFGHDQGLVALPGAIAFAPTSASFSRNWTVNVRPSAVALGAPSAGFAAARTMAVTPAAVANSGSQAIFSYTPAGPRNRQASLPGFPFGNTYVNETRASQGALGGSFLNETGTPAPKIYSLSAVPGGIGLFAPSATFTSSAAQGPATTTLNAQPGSIALGTSSASFTSTRAAAPVSSSRQSQVLGGFPFMGSYVIETSSYQRALPGGYLNERPQTRVYSIAAQPAQLALGSVPATFTSHVANTTLTAAPSLLALMPGSAAFDFVPRPRLRGRYRSGLGLSLSLGKIPRITSVYALNAGTSSLALASASATFTSAVANQPSLRQVATRSRIQNRTVSGRQFNSQSFHYARDSISTIRIALPNWFVSYPDFIETGTGDDAVFAASIQYPIGSAWTPFKLGGQASGIVASGTTGWTDDLVLPVTIPDGAKFLIRVNGTLGPNAVGIPVSVYPTPIALTSQGDGMEYAAAGLADKTSGGTITPTSTTAMYFPAAIVAQSSKKSVALIGDSRCAGAGDTYSGTSGDSGELARSIGPSLAYINLGVYGDLAFKFVASHALRIALAQYCTHAVIELGINDTVQSTPRTAAQVVADQQTIRSYLPSSTPVWGTTKPPKTNSSNGWTDTNGQTVDPVRGPILQDLNALIRAGVAGFAGYLEIANVVSTGSIWIPNYTADGAHENQAAYTAIQTSGAIDPAVFV